MVELVELGERTRQPRPGGHQLAPEAPGGGDACGEPVRVGGKPERGEQAVWRAAFYNVVFLGVAGLCFVVFANPIAHLFTDDPAVADIAADCLRIISYGYPFYAYGMVLTNSLNGAGDTWTPTWLNLFCFWLWEIPLAWWLARDFNLGPQGVAWAVTIAFSTLAVASAVLFRRGRWKAKHV